MKILLVAEKLERVRIKRSLGQLMVWSQELISDKNFQIFDSVTVGCSLYVVFVIEYLFICVYIHFKLNIKPMIESIERNNIIWNTAKNSLLEVQPNIKYLIEL